MKAEDTASSPLIHLKCIPNDSDKLEQSKSEDDPAVVTNEEDDKDEDEKLKKELLNSDKDISELCDMFVGKAMTIDGFHNVLNDVNIGEYIVGMDEKVFLGDIFD